MSEQVCLSPPSTRAICKCCLGCKCLGEINSAGICCLRSIPSFGPAASLSARRMLPTLPRCQKPSPSQSKPVLGATFPSPLQSWLPRASVLQENQAQLYKSSGCLESGPCGVSAGGVRQEASQEEALGGSCSTQGESRVNSESCDMGRKRGRGRDNGLLALTQTASSWSFPFPPGWGRGRRQGRRRQLISRRVFLLHGVPSAGCSHGQGGVAPRAVAPGR